jgi:hypothetical protein
LPQATRPTAIALFALIGSLSCAEPSGPNTNDHPQQLLIAGTEDGAVVVDLDWGAVIRTMGPEFVSHGPSTMDARNQVVSVGRLPTDELVMVGLDAGTGLETWRASIANGNSGVLLDGVRLGASSIAVHHTRPEVYLWRASVAGLGFGVAQYHVPSNRVTRFIGPIDARFRGMVATPPTSEHPNGCLVIALDDGPSSSARSFLNRVCDGTFQDADSVAIDPPSRFVGQVSLSADGNDILVMTDLEFLKFDAATLELEVKASRPLDAPFFLTRARGRLIIPDVGTSVVASTGIIYLLDANLELASIIDLRVLPFGERPLGIIGAEESADGRWLYILGGVARDGPSYGPEQTHVLVIELATGAIRKVVRLKTFWGGGPYLIP